MTSLEGAVRCSDLSHPTDFFISQTENSCSNSNLELTSTQLATSQLFQSCFQRVFDCSTLLSIASGNLLGVLTKAYCLKGLSPIFQERAWIARGISSLSGCLMEATGIHFIPQIIQRDGLGESGLGGWAHLSLTILLMKGMANLPLSNPLVQHGAQDVLMTALDRICGVVGLIESPHGSFLEGMIQAEVMSCQMIVGVQCTSLFAPELKNLEAAFHLKGELNRPVGGNRKNCSNFRKFKEMFLPAGSPLLAAENGLLFDRFSFPSYSSSKTPPEKIFICEMQEVPSYPPRTGRVSAPLQEPVTPEPPPTVITKETSPLDPALLKLPIRSAELNEQLEKKARELQAYQFWGKYQLAGFKARQSLREGEAKAENPDQMLLDFMKEGFIPNHHRHLSEILRAVNVEMERSFLDPGYPKHPDWEEITNSFKMSQSLLNEMDLFIGTIESPLRIGKILSNAFGSLSSAANIQIALFQADMYLDGPHLLYQIRDYYQKAHHSLQMAVFIQCFSI